MNNDRIIQRLEQAGVRPTANRILVLRAILAGNRPLSLKDLTDELPTLDKSSAFRVLSLLVAHHVLHTLEDGVGIVRYEVCKGLDCSLEEDIHAHFYCEVCQKVFCLDSVRLPSVTLPEGFRLRTMNYMFKGTCPDCAAGRKDGSK